MAHVHSKNYSMDSSVFQLFAALILMCGMSSCKHDPIVPPPPVADTTSHSMVWHTELIGYGASYLNDVTIIDENNIWAVGDFYLKDSLGNIDPTIYNALYWNGHEWIPKRIYTTYNGVKNLDFIRAIIAFDSTDIWIASPGPAHLSPNGDYDILPQSAQKGIGRVWKFWGTSSKDLFMVAAGGKLTHFDGTDFVLMPTGVTSRFCDIYGQGNNIYIASYWYDNQIRPSGVFRYLRNIDHFQFLFPDAVDTSQLKYLTDCFGLWVSPTGTLWAIGGGHIFKPLDNNLPIGNINPLDYALLGIRGNADNDVWAAGVGGRTFHYNGATWREYPELWPSATRAVEYHCLAVKGDIVVLAGVTYDDNHAIVTIGKRMP